MNDVCVSVWMSVKLRWWVREISWKKIEKNKVERNRKTRKKKGNIEREGDKETSEIVGGDWGWMMKRERMEEGVN